MKGIINKMLFLYKKVRGRQISFECFFEQTARRCRIPALLPFFFKYLVLMPFVLFSQETTDAPIVSNGMAYQQNNHIHILWTDTLGATGPVTIFSSDVPIDIACLTSQQASPGITSAQVPYGVQHYVDDVGNQPVRYYYIAASNASGVPYLGDRIAHRNYLEVFREPYHQTTQESPPPLPSMPSSLQASVNGGGVVITFTARGGTSVLYRSIEPLRHMTDIVNAVIVQSDVGSPFTDYPLPGVPYYYAVISQEALSQGTADIKQGINATVEPILVLLSNSDGGVTVQNMRPMPLPLISLSSDILDGVGPVESQLLKPPVLLSNEASHSIADIKRMERPQPVRKPHAFKEDMKAPENGEEYAFHSIIQGVFVQKVWSEARDQIQAFLSLPRSDQIEVRSRFYLGQVYYFLNQPKESLFEFLAIRAVYPQESYEWIDACMALLVE
ncbi:MAG: hypothetical protein LBP19_06860 [Treponema sp.]|jgi:hypothetical protein|nr:hypothetical protein [Treponema sp.]